MTLYKKAGGVVALAVGLGLALPALGPSAFPAAAQDARYTDARDVISRTQNDLERAASFLQNKKKEQERVRNAQKHLSEVDRSLAKGKFDKDKLDGAIEDIKNILDHNVLQSVDRDVLMKDLTNLRAVRARRG